MVRSSHNLTLFVISTSGVALYQNRLNHKSIKGILKYRNELEMVEEKTYKLTNTLEELRATNIKIEITKKEWEDTFDAISDSICIVDRDYRILRVNKTMVKFFGMEMKELSSKHCYEVIHGTDKPIDDCPLIKCAQSGETESIETYNTKLNKTLSITVFPRFDRYGKVINFVHIIRDITERKLAQNKLQESEEQFRDTFDQAGVGIAHVAVNGRFLKMNKLFCDILGHSEEELRNLALQDITHYDELEADTNLANHKLDDTFKSYTMEKRYLKRNGTIVWVNLTVSLVRKPDGEPEYFICVVDDITERLKSEEQLRISYKMASLGRLAAGVFHEILNPVNIISSHIQLLLMEAEKSSKTEEDLKSIQEEIARIVKISDNLLRSSRKGGPGSEKIEMNDLLERTISLVEPDMKLENIRFVRKFDDSLPTVTANSNQLRQVFLNLITNARDAMPEGGTITISTENITGGEVPFVRIKTTDTGCGIAKENLKKLFDPFFTTKSEGKRTGLGLSTSYNIIEDHAGAISVESEVGKGTTFTVDLPVKDL